MPVYFLVKIEINDQESFNQYATTTPPPENGRVLAVDDAPVTIEGQWKCTKTVLAEFPSEEAFYNWYESPHYQEALKVRQASSVCNAVLLHGVQ